MTWLAIVLVGLGSYVFRIVPLLVLPRLGLRSSRLEQAAQHAGTAALSALMVSSVTHRVALGDAGPTLAGVGVALVLALREAPMLVVVVAGLVVASTVDAVGLW